MQPQLWPLAFFTLYCTILNLNERFLSHLYPKDCQMIDINVHYSLTGGIVKKENETDHLEYEDLVMSSKCHAGGGTTVGE